MLEFLLLTEYLISNDMLESPIQDAAAAAKLLQSCLTLCNPIDSCPPGSSIPEILQARILEWVAISFPTIQDDKMLICTFEDF